MLIQQVLIGSGMMIITSIIHAGGMAVGLRWLILTHANHLEKQTLLVRSLVVGVLVFIMFLAIIIDASVWSLVYLLLDAIEDFETALYFSVVTYTTLGFGDVVLSEEWRLLSSFEAANGIIMFGWTTALIIVALHHFSKTLKKLEEWDKEK